VVLGAGASSRYGGVKQRELLPAVLAALAGTSVGSVVVVEGAHPVADVVPEGVGLVHCDDWERGPGVSLRAGLAALGGDVDRALVVLADGPDLDPRAVERMLAVHAPAAAASYDGTRNHPVVLAREVWATIPDEGARALAVELVDCSDLRPPGDVDVRLR
jgi:CTP:molybdopterin cytidylyltransferase MocA